MVFHVAEAGLELPIAEDDLKLLILLPLPPGCWGYRRAPLCQISAVLGWRLAQTDYILS